MGFAISMIYIDFKYFVKFYHNHKIIDKNLELISRDHSNRPLLILSNQHFKFHSTCWLLHPVVSEQGFVFDERH